MIPARRVFVWLYAASGAAALVYEVTWTRLLTLQLGHTVAAASTVLAAFMGGLALGAWWAGSRRHRDDAADDLRAYAGLELAVALSALLLPLALRAMVPALAWAYADGEAAARFAAVRVAISLLLVGIPAVAMGATFPIATDWFAQTPADAGFLYAANTAGAAAGAIAAGFWLVPAVGLRATTWVGIALNLAGAGGSWWLASRITLADDGLREAAARLPAPGPGRVAKGDRSHRNDRKESLRTRRPRSSPSSSSFPSSASSPSRASASAAPGLAAWIRAPALASSAAALSGFAALVYEVAWTRLLALVIGPTTYAFATMAASFISGLALGSAGGTRLARRTARPAAWLGVMLTVSALAATVAAWYAAVRMPLVVATEVADPAAELGGVVATQALGVALLLLPMTLALGAAFPLALAVAGGPQTMARDAARVYASNTLGAVCGALGAGFLLVPRFGLRATIRDTAIVAAIGGAGCLAAALAGPQPPGQFHRRSRRPIPAAIALGATAVAAIALVPGWDRALLASGAYKYAPYMAATDLESVLRAGTLVYYREGAAATVSVRDLTGTRSLSIDGKVDASNSGDMLTQRMLGLLPVLIHGNAQDVCIIGLGSGVTLGSALGSGTVRRADVVEISPEVVEASHFFDSDSGAPLTRPGVRLIIGDGRSHLLLSPRQYDVIVSEPSNPWMSGVAMLFTREFFEAAQARLRPGGLLCQWAHTYDISSDDLRSIVRTFASVFPQGTLWLVGEGDLLLIGAKGSGTGGNLILPRLAAVEAGCRKGTVSTLLAGIGVTEGTAPFALLSSYAGGPRELEQYAGNSVIQTDDHTPLEYSAPRGIYGRTRQDNGRAIRELHAEPPPAVRNALELADARDWASRGSMELKAQAFGAAYDAFHRVVTLDSRNTAALAGLSDAAGGAHRLDEERDWLQAIALKEPDNAAVRIELSRVLAVGGDAKAAIDMASDAMRLAKDDPRPAEQLASVLADTGDADRLAPLADALISRFPDRADPYFYRATALYLRGRTSDAVTALERVIAIRPDHARAQNLLGAACATLGRRECAQAAFEASIRANPRDPSAYVNAGLFSLETAGPAAAEAYFASALVIDPTSPAARNGLSQARSLLNR
jgi:spermidine synthase